MNKKTILKMGIYVILGAIVGASITLGMTKLTSKGSLVIFEQINDFFVSNSLAFIIGILLVLYVPAVIFVTKGKKISRTMENDTDEEIERKGKIVDKNINLGLTMSQVFMVLNFMIFGLTFNGESKYNIIVLVIFMFNSLAASILEITTIKHIQKYDKRIKGDPMSLKFGADFLGSLDEAEQLLVYKSGYKAFQNSRAAAMAIIIILMLIKLVFEVGESAILAVGIMLIIQSLSYYYHANRFSKSKEVVS